MDENYMFPLAVALQEGMTICNIFSMPSTQQWLTLGFRFAVFAKIALYHEAI